LASRIPYRPWVRREKAVAERFARALGRGRFRSAGEAARACMPELQEVWQSDSSLRPRKVKRVHSWILLRTRALGLSWASRHWKAVEIRMLAPFAAAYVRGEYPSVEAAGRACRRALPARVRRNRSLISVWQKLFRLAREQGLRQWRRTSDDAEVRVLDRYVRALHEGRYRCVREAAPDCRSELERLRRRRPDADRLRSRTLGWVSETLQDRSAATHLPRYHNFLTQTERKLLEDYARRVDRGELPNWLTAAQHCLAEMKRRYARRRPRGPMAPRRLTSHSIHTVHNRILALAHRLNLRGPRCIRWSGPERRLLDSWIRWYARHRGTRRLSPMKQASEGLQGDLEKIGCNRRLSSCRYQLRKYFLRSQGAA
jgi:hypothetical protein